VAYESESARVLYNHPRPEFPIPRSHPRSYFCTSDDAKAMTDEETTHIFPTTLIDSTQSLPHRFLVALHSKFTKPVPHSPSFSTYLYHQVHERPLVAENTQKLQHAMFFVFALFAVVTFKTQSIHLASPFAILSLLTVIKTRGYKRICKNGPRSFHVTIIHLFFFF
jgi:hypothetical protein